MLSKKLFEKYEEKIQNIALGRSYNYIPEDSKIRILDIIKGLQTEEKNKQKTIKHVKDLGLSEKNEKNIKLVDNLKNIKSIDILNEKGKLQTINIKNYTALYNKKHGKHIEFKGTKAQIQKKKTEIKNEVERDIIRYLKNGKAGKMQIVEIDEFDDNLKVKIEYSFDVVESGGKRRRHKVDFVDYDGANSLFECEYEGENNTDKIIRFITNKIQDDLSDWGLGVISATNGKGRQSNIDVDYMKIENIKIEKAEDLNNNNKILKEKDMKLKDRNPLNLKDMFGDNIDINKSDVNCVLNCFSFLPQKQIKKLNILLNDEKDYITPIEIYNFCSEQKIKCIIYSITGAIIKRNKKNSCNQHPIYLLAYNDHAYILKNEFKKCVIPHDFADMKKEIMNNSQLDKKFIEINKNGFIPTDIKINNLRLSSFIHNDTYYFNNKTYKSAEYLLSKLDLVDKIKFYTNEMNILDIIIPKYNDGCKFGSFFPYKFTKTIYQYVAETFDTDKKIKSIDANKFYSFSVKDLPYLIYVDFRYSKITKEPKDIIEHYLYNVKTNNNSIYIPSNGVYWGKILIEAKKAGIEFEITEEIQTFKRDNFYSKMVTDLYENYDETLNKMYNEANKTKINTEEETHFIKDILNRHIGKMTGKQFNSSKERIFTDYSPSNQAKYNDKTHNITIGNNEYTFNYIENENESINIDNNYPISIMVKDFAHMRLIEKINKLGLKDEDIIAIFTDNIVYYDNGQNFEPDIYWKEMSIEKTMEKIIDARDAYDPKINKDFSFFKPEYMKENKNVLVDGYAGMGKSTYICDILLKALDHKDYIILSPSHATIKDYKQKGLNCDVVQKYTLGNIIPTEKNVIIDEIGMMCGQGFRMLTKCMIKDKRIFAFGDFNQLDAPFEEAKDLNDIFLSTLFNKIIKCKANYRNNIKVKLYESLMSRSAPKKIINDLIKQYLSHPEPEIYLGIRLKTIERKNLDILSQLGKIENIKYENKKFSYDVIDLNDVPLLCKCNDYSDYGLYNNFDCKILEYDEKFVVVKFEDEQIKIKTKIFHKRFSFGYAVNLHAFQGKQSERICFLNDDVDLLSFPKNLYTTISRIKEDLNDEQKEFNKTQTYHIDISGYDDIIGDD